MDYVPDWVEGLEGGLELFSALVIAYQAFSHWFANHLSYTDVERIHTGGERPWPRPRVTNEDKVLDVLSLVYKALYGDTWQRTVHF